MGKRWQGFKATVAVAAYSYLGVPTNYGGTYMNGVWVTFLRGSDGVVRIQTPTNLYGTAIVLQDGKWRLA